MGKVMNDNDLALLQALIDCNEQSLKNGVAEVLRKNFYRKKKVHNTNDYLFVEGNIPVMLIAHLDTVFHYNKKELFYDREKNVLWSPDGAGFDDRAGVLGVLKCLSGGMRPYLLFTTQEEKGGLGASKASSELKERVRGKLKYMIELDRRGENDCVFYNNDNREFVKYVESFGFKEQYGTFSDIDILGPAWNVSSVNLSIGYLDEHTYGEHLYVDWFYATIEKVKTMLSVIEDAEYFEHVEGWSGYWPDVPMNGQGVDHFSLNGRSFFKCDACGKWVNDDALLPVHSDKGLSRFCPQCSPTHIGMCALCGEMYETTPDDADLICDDCRRNLK